MKMRHDWRRMERLDDQQVKDIKARLKEARAHCHAPELPTCYCENYAPKGLEVELARVLLELERLKSAMLNAMSDMPSDQSRGYETLSIALGEP